MIVRIMAAAIAIAATFSIGNAQQQSDSLTYPQESRHCSNMKQLTFGGDNAEAYWSFDNKFLSFQSNNPAWGLQCDQIFYMPADGSTAGQKPPMVSNGKGRTTCSYYMPDGKHILYASTFEGGDACPQESSKEHGSYIWMLYPDFDIYVADLNGKIIQKLTSEPGYDAEATLSPKGNKIVFTSMRSGDPELYTMNIDGSDVKQITHDLGYDGGAFFSPDGKQIIFRASRPKTDAEVEKYKKLLSENKVEPLAMELFICDVDGSNLQQITHLGGANWAPFMTPDGKKVLFSSNHHSKRGFPFNIFSINVDGTGLEQITFDKTFDSFPMFSPDGKKLVFSSNRNNGGTRDTNVFVADWKD